MFTTFILFAATFVSATSIGSRHNDHHDASSTPLPSAWYHTAEHPVHKLFKRGPTDGVEYAPVGSPSMQMRFSVPIPAI